MSRLTDWLDMTSTVLTGPYNSQFQLQQDHNAGIQYANQKAVVFWADANTKQVCACYFNP